MRAQLERQGLRVLMTRQGNEDPTFDQRAAVANAQPGAIFVSLHVSSTGPVGTARVYYFDFSKIASTAGRAGPRSVGVGLAPWGRAQEPHVRLSRRLAELVQVELAQKFRGSPETPAGAAVHQLRSVVAPAIAVEISSVTVPNVATLEGMAPELAAAVAHGIASFRPLYESGGN